MLKSIQNTVAKKVPIHVRGGRSFTWRVCNGGGVSNDMPLIC